MASGHRGRAVRQRRCGRGGAAAGRPAALRCAVWEEARSLGMECLRACVHSLACMECVHAFVACRDQKVYVLDTATGKIVAKAVMETNKVSGTHSRGGRGEQSRRQRQAHVRARCPIPHRTAPAHTETRTMRASRQARLGSSMAAPQRCGAPRRHVCKQASKQAGGRAATPWL